jgi:hypothetical protein
VLTTANGKPIHLEDIQTLKGLVERVGPAALRTLIGVMAERPFRSGKIILIPEAGGGGAGDDWRREKFALPKRSRERFSAVCCFTLVGSVEREARNAAALNLGKIAHARPVPWQEDRGRLMYRGA